MSASCFLQQIQLEALLALVALRRLFRAQLSHDRVINLLVPPVAAAAAAIEIDSSSPSSKDTEARREDAAAVGATAGASPSLIALGDPLQCDAQVPGASSLREILLQIKRAGGGGRGSAQGDALGGPPAERAAALAHNLLNH